MNLSTLYQQQEDDIKSFESTRDQVWREMKERHSQIIAAFGSRENLPEDSLKAIQAEEADYQKQWSMDGGKKYIALKQQHKQQFNSVTLKPKPTMDLKKKLENQIGEQKKKAEKTAQGQKKEIKTLTTERDKKKAQMVKAQKAIVKKQQEHKKTRGR